MKTKALTKMNAQLLVVGSLLVFSNSTLAAPTVVGNTISWPDDGWYQVQDESNYQSICNGTTSCDVDNGSYLVVNHTTGERFPGIAVSDTTGTANPIVVTGNTISWPDDGWYQVQDESNYQSICNGTTSCDVDNGSYLVVNHTTGERFPGIAVSDTTGTANPIVVTGNTISWPDDGWYQVQRADTFESLCNGVQSCDVVNGTYVVINHTTDERFEDVEVGQEGIVPEPAQANLEVVQDKTFRITWQDSPTATYYRVLENPDGISGFNVVAGNIGTTIQTYDHRVALYKRTSARYIVEACNNSGCTASDTMFITGTLEQGVGYFKASNTKGGGLDFSHGSPIAYNADEFGSSVKLSADGNTLVIAAIREDSAATGINGKQDDDSARDSGAVYVFTRIEGEWQQQAYIKASNTKATQFFGLQLGLSADGNTLAVGVSSESSAAQGINGDQVDDSANSSGAVYVFVRNNGAWYQESYLKASNAELGDRFGYAIDLSGDGNTLVVGARSEDGSGRSVNSVKDNEGRSNGAAYVFTRSGRSWSEQAYLKSSNSDENDSFGSAVSISVDGSTIAVYAPWEDSISTGINGNQNDNSGEAVGAVYVFVSSGNSWQQEAYIKSSIYPDKLGEAQLSLSGDGNTLAIGVRENSRVTLDQNSPQANDELSFSGSVYILTRSNSNWQHQAFIKANIPRRGGVFGSSLDLSNDGNTLAVGSHGETNATAVGINGDQNGNIQTDNRFQPDVGAVYVFERKNEDWKQQAYVKASNTQTNDRFAWLTTGWFLGSGSGPVSLSGDGNTLAVGAIFESSDSAGINGDQNNNSAPASGAVYLY